MPPNQRKTKKTPDHINLEKLPDRVWFNATGCGRWMLTYYDEYGKKHAKRICGPSATLPEIWQAAEAQKEKTITTFKTLSDEFKTTHAWHKLSILTQKDYEGAIKVIINRPTTGGKLGDLSINQWTVGLIRKYRDKRAEESESRANKELSYIKRLFAWAYEYEKVPSNPANGVKKLTIAPRQHYAEDKDYYFLLAVAKESNFWYASYAMELAYLCKMRLAEVLDLTDANELENGLKIIRRKGSKTTIVEWQPRLTQLWKELKIHRNEILAKRKQPHPINANRRFLFISDRTGNPIIKSSLKTAMDRINKQASAKAARLGIEYTHFTFHDLKKKGVTDTEGDKMQASGHKTQAMVNLYDLSVAVVKPTKD